MDDFILRALIAGIGVALIAGPLGCFVVWRRMSYFGATLSHSALLGIALGLLLDVNSSIAIIVVCIVVALALVALQERHVLATDTLLGILAHAALAFGLVALAFLETVRIDLLGYLFGDILAVTRGDIAWIYGGGAVCLALLAYLWRDLLAITVHEELARAEGINTTAVRLGFMLLIAITIAVAMKIVGILLIVSMLIIPAATARRFAATPEAMALIAAIVGVITVVGGIGVSLQWDTPAGPSVVCVASLLFALAFLVPIGRPAGSS